MNSEFWQIRRAFLLSLLLLTMLVGVSVGAWAHDTALSGIRILYRKDDVVVTVSTPISRLIKAEGTGKTILTPVDLDLAIRKRVHFRFDGNSFSPKTANVIGDNNNDILTWQTIVAPVPKDCEILSRLYPEDTNSRTVVTLVRDGQAFQETLLDAEHPAMLKKEGKSSPVTVGARYLREGISHIFGGPDHVLFILGLLLLGGSLKTLLRTVTAFTLAHSITLSIAATGLWNPSPRIVEPLIALSIVAVAVENLRHLQNANKIHPIKTRNRDFRPYFAFAFGLIHGFGFAGALSEVGLPQHSLGVALAGFNIGVEIGQVTIVLLAVPLLNLLAKKNPRIHQSVLLVGSLLIGVAGGYWFVSRLLP